MKKIIGIVVLLLLCIAGTAFAAGVPMVQTTGTIVKVEDDKATIKANEPGKDVALYIGRAPYFIDKQSGKRLGMEDVKAGLQVTAFYAPKLTKSIPPLGVASLMVLGPGDDRMAYVRVSRAVPADNKSVLLYYDEAAVRITDNVLANCNDIRLGDQLLVWINASYTLQEGTKEGAVEKALMLNRTL